MILILGGIAAVEIAGVILALAVAKAAAQRPPYGPPLPLHRRATDNA